jgi:hypothetical protein
MDKKPALRLVDSRDAAQPEPHQTTMFGRPALSIIPSYADAASPNYGPAPRQLNMMLMLPSEPLTAAETDDLEYIMIFEHHLGG